MYTYITIYEGKIPICGGDTYLPINEYMTRDLQQLSDLNEIENGQFAIQEVFSSR